MDFQVTIPVLIAFVVSVALGPVVIPFLRRLSGPRALPPI